jgi:hypothetical protein
LGKPICDKYKQMPLKYANHTFQVWGRWFEVSHLEIHEQSSHPMSHGTDF